MPTILVVEDDLAIRELYRFVFDLNGYETVIACNGKEGLAFLITMKPDMIVLDWRMPVLSGMEFLEAMKNAGYNYPILVATADISAKYDIEDRGLTCIIKPFKHIDDLLSEVEKKLAVKVS